MIKKLQSRDSRYQDQTILKINEMIDYLNDNESGNCNDDIIKTYIMELKQTIASLKKRLHEKSTIPKLCAMLESYEETQKKVKKTIIIELVPEERVGSCDGCFFKNSHISECLIKSGDTTCENGFIWKMEGC